MASLDREHGRGRSQERGRGRQTTYVVKKTVRDVGGAQYPMLTRTNYAEWVVLMKVMLKARRLWAAVTVGTCRRPHPGAWIPTSKCCVFPRPK